MTNEQTAEKPQSSAWEGKSPTLGKLAAALAKAQGKIEAAKKDSKNPFFNSKYADLAAVWAAIREPLATNELAILQEPSAAENRVAVTTTLMHSSGEYIRSCLIVPVGKQDAQGYGSAITYARRYALQSIVGIAPEDDDGNAATGKESAPPKAAPAKQPTQVKQATGGITYNLSTLATEKWDYAMKLLQEAKAEQVTMEVWRSPVAIPKLSNYAEGA